MTNPAPDMTHGTTARSRSVAILGADALIAAEPATPVQLAHACLRGGFHSVLPASWGDELIAGAVLQEMQNRKAAPAIQCTCPLVARRLLSSGPDLQPFLVSLVSPPVAAAKYVRAVSSEKLRITYVGRCPGAADDDIDARITPEELLATLADRGISLTDQPLAFDSILPPDRRRYRSQAGGIPVPRALWDEADERTLAEIEGADLPAELAQVLLSGHDVLIDCTPAVGCYCRGTDPRRPDHSAAELRQRIAALEPPQSSSPILLDGVQVDLRLELPQVHAVPADPIVPQPLAAADDAYAQAEQPASIHDVESVARVSGGFEVSAATRRRSPGQGMRAIVLPTPASKDIDGRQLPRAYVARRRPSPRGLRAITPDDPEPVTAPSAPAAFDRVTAPDEPRAPAAPPNGRAPGSREVPAAGPHVHVSAAIIMALAAVVLLSTMIGVIVGRWISR